MKNLPKFANFFKVYIYIYDYYFASMATSLLISWNVTGVSFSILFSLMPGVLMKIEFDKNFGNLPNLTKIWNSSESLVTFYWGQRIRTRTLTIPTKCRRISVVFDICLELFIHAHVNHAHIHKEHFKCRNINKAI